MPANWGKLKIFAIGAYPPNIGGGPQAGWNIANQMAKMGHELTVFSEAVAGKQIDARQNIKLIPVTLKRSLNTPGIQSYNLARPLRRIVGFGGGIARKPFTDAIKSELRKGKPDAIVVNFGAPFLSFIQGLARRNNIPVVVVFHGSDVHNLTTHEFSRIKKTLLRQYKKTDAKIAVSNYLKITLNALGVNDIEVIPNAVDHSVFKRINPTIRARTRRRLGIKEDAVLLAHVSTLRPIKRPLDIVNAAKRALKKSPNLHFLIVGDGPLRQKMVQRAKELGIGKKFIFTGTATQIKVNRLINASDALVLPSQREGMPLAILEAFACGKPVIASAVGGIPEIVRNYRNGILTEPGNISQLAKSMVLISNPTIRKKLSKGAEETAKQSHLAKRARIYVRAIRRGIKRRQSQTAMQKRLRQKRR